MTTAEYELPASFQEQTGPMFSRVSVDLLLPGAPAPSIELVNDDKHMELQRKALQVLFLPCFGVSDHIFRAGVDPAHTRDGFPTIRSAEIVGSNFSLELNNNFNLRKVSAQMSINGIYHVVAAVWSSRGEIEESRLDIATARWFQIDVLERVLSEIMSMPRC